MGSRFAPDPAALVGNLDTSETAGAGAPHARIEGITAVFDVARATDLAWALRAMDESDLAVPPNLVQTSPGLTVNRGDPDGDRRRVTADAERTHAALREQGMDVDPLTGQVTRRDHTHPWRNHAASLGPMTVVDDQPADRSAG